MRTGPPEAAAVRVPGSARREPQQDRGWATRSRLLESAVSCLAELGWSGATLRLNVSVFCPDKWNAPSWITPGWQDGTT